MTLALVLLPLVLQLGASIALGHDCSSPSDCEETSGYNGTVSIIGGIIAIIVSILGSDLGGVLPGLGGTTAAAPPPSTTTTQPKPVTASTDPNTLMDPWDKKPLPTWDPTKFGPGENGQPGQPGWVWWGHNWISPEDARDKIKESIDADNSRARESKDFADESRHKSDEWMRDRERQLQKEADDEHRRHDAEDRLRLIQDIARTRGDDDIWKRTLDGGRGKDGQLDPNWVDDLQHTLRNRIGRGVDDAPPVPQKSWIREGTENTINDALHNPIIRVGTGILSGGTTEIYFTGQGAWDAMHHAADDAAKKNKDLDWTDAFRSGMHELGREKLPINTIETLVEKGRDATWKDLGGSVIKDLGTVPGLVETGRNLGSSINHLNKGGSVGDIVNARADPLNLFGQPKDPAKWPGEQVEGPLGVTPRGKGMPSGSKVDPDEFGIPEMNGRQIKAIAEKHGVDVEVRPTSPYAKMRIEEGDLPKPMPIKAKSMNELDPYLGAPPEHMGRVAYFEPKMPDTTGMDPKLADAIGKRFTQRMGEFNELSHDMDKLIASGKVRVDNGVIVDNATGKYFAGDHDVFSIKGAGGGPVSDAVKGQVVRDLQGGPADIQHGALKDWKLDPLDPDYAKNLKIKTSIEADHLAGGDPLIKFGAHGRTPTSSYNEP